MIGLRMDIFPGPDRTDMQRGVALVTCLCLLGAVMIFGVAAANLATQDERGARVERDRQLAFHAAEAALRDAERDIDGTTAVAPDRRRLFLNPGQGNFMPGCVVGDAHPAQGLCLPLGAGPAWERVDLADTNPGTAPAVAYGRFSGRKLTTGLASLPALLPRYIIEALPYRYPGASAEAGAPAWIFRITAIGFGANPAQRVVLQAIYRTAPPCCP
jgi:type IV pilus assembly protein PilX